MRLWCHQSEKTSDGACDPPALGQQKTIEENLVHIEVIDLRGWKRVRSPKEIVRHSMSRERDGGCQDPFSLRIGRRRQSQKQMKKEELEKIERSWRGA